MFRKEDKENDIPNGLEQKQMRDDLIMRLDQVIIGWNPKFLQADGTSSLSDTILGNLQCSREKIADMIFPRSDTRLRIYYDSIDAELKKLENAVMTASYAGDVFLAPAAQKIFDFVCEWEKLH